jgi:carbon monoxide dehydrogenase subunit G
MITLDLSTLVDRPLPEIFEFLSNPLNLPKWQKMVASIEQISPGAPAVGTKYKVAAEVMGRKIDGQMRITAFEPPHKVGFVNQAGPMRVEITVTLKPVGSGAKIALHAEGNPAGVFALAEGMLAGKIKSEMEANLARLKAVLESKIS